MTDIASPSPIPGLRRWRVASPAPRAYRLGDLDPALSRFTQLRLTVHSGFDPCEAAWRQATAECAHWGFQSFDWLATWQQTIGAAERVAPYPVFVADPGGRPLLVLPLGIYRRHGLRALGFLGGIVTDYNAPVIDRDFAAAATADEIARLWAAVLRLLPRVDLIWLHRMPETIDGVANPLAALPGARPAEHAYAAPLPASGAAYQASRKHSLVKYTRRRRRQLGEHGPVVFTAAATPDEAKRILHELRPLKSRRWRETRCRDLFAEAPYREFYDRMSERPVAGGEANAFRLSVGGKVIAALWGFSLRDRLYCLLLTRADGEWARYSPGSLLIEGIIDWCIARPEIVVFDLSSGEEAFKQRWCDSVLQLYDCRVARSLAGHAYLALYRAKEWLKTRRDLRNFVRRLKGKRPK